MPVTIDNKTKDSMTYQQAKVMVAKRYRLGKTLVTGHLSSYWDEAAELYARSKWDEAAKATRLDDGVVIPTDISKEFYLRPLPEFKP